MRAVVQRVSRASVSVEGQIIGSIEKGICVFAGAMGGDTAEDVSFVAAKLASLRIFPDEAGRMNLDVRQIEGAVLLVSQFTLAADTTSGTRPSFSSAMAPEAARGAIEQLAAALRALGLVVQTGEFGALMTVEIINDGPVTILIDSRAKKRK